MRVSRFALDNKNKTLIKILFIIFLILFFYIHKYKQIQIRTMLQQQLDVSRTQNLGQLVDKLFTIELHDQG